MKWNILIFLLAAGFLVACGGEGSKKKSTKSGNEAEYTISKEKLEKDTAFVKELMEKVEAAKAAGKVPFENEHWELSHFVIDGKKMTPSGITLDAYLKGGRLDGNSGCNNYFAAYSADTLQQSITVRGLASTEKQCQGSVAGQERRFQSMMKSANKYVYDDKGLRIISEQGELNFVKANK
jgi:heat shock protein HslJ